MTEHREKAQGRDTQSVGSSRRRDLERPRRASGWSTGLSKDARKLAGKTKCVYEGSKRGILGTGHRGREEGTEDKRYGQIMKQLIRMAKEFRLILKTGDCG